MKNTGIVRRVDELGRVVIPKELRTTLDIKEFDGLEIYTNGRQIILQKKEISCVFCNDTEQDNLLTIKDKKVCIDCANIIQTEKEVNL